MPMKYRYDKETGKVVENPEKKREEITLLETPNPPPIWFRNLYEDYVESVRRGGPR
jgi:hypothetical protein